MYYGKEFCGRAMLTWAHTRQVMLTQIEPGKPTRNPCVESFNGRLRGECLNEHWFLNLAYSQAIIEAWRREYNEERPKNVLGGHTRRLRQTTGQETGYSSNRSLSTIATQGGVTSGWPDKADFRCISAIEAQINSFAVITAQAAGSRKFNDLYSDIW
jgi:putative transposase